MKIFYQKKTFVLLILHLFTSVGLAQNNVSEFKFKSNPDEEFWWLQHNNFGQEKSTLLLNYTGQIQKEKIELYINAFLGNSKNVIYIPSTYFKYVHSDKFFLKFGRYYRDFSTYLNDDLSSGSMLVSNNAQALKKIGFFYKNKLKKRNYISYFGGLSHGVFDKNNFYSIPPYQHEKFIYLEIDLQNSLFGAGLVHEAIWSGTTTQGFAAGKQPGTIKDFFKVFISADGPLLEGEPHPNALGNHLGIWDFYYIKKFNNNSFKAYYQHFFEDTSSFRFKNKTDGLWGFEFKNEISKNIILIEFLNTTNCCYDPPYQSDNYYWNYQYLPGWRYNEKIIGNAFVNPKNTTIAEMIKLVHLGIKGNYNNINYKILSSRKIHINDDLKYKIELNRTISNSLTFGTTLYGEKKRTGMSFFVLYNINQK